MVKKRETVYMRIYEEDRDFLEIMKRKLKEKSFAITLNRFIKLIKKQKLHLDLIQLKGGKS